MMKVAYSVLVIVSQGRRRRCGHEEEVKIYLKETGCEDIDWFHVAEWMVVVNSIIN
jgi:hypothetical protein